jgi:hypothetical protein
MVVNLLINNKTRDKTILKYGSTIWNYINDKKPDCRHGVKDEEKTVLTKEDSTFWINQIINYVQYIVDIIR